MKLITTKKIPKDEAIKEIITDLLKTFLKNPYLKRPHIMITSERTYFILDRTWYMLENEIKPKIRQEKEIQVKEYYGKIEEVLEPKESISYDKIEIRGNEARKFNEKELKETFERLLNSSGALIKIIMNNEKEIKIWIPIDSHTEWNE